MIDESLLLQVQYTWVIDILRRMEGVMVSESTDEEKLQQLQYLIKQALKAEANND
jgi:hypothetical protein